jgi:hypothetical protein
VVDDIERIDLQHTALVDAALPALDGPPGTARMLVDRPGHLSALTDGPGRQLLSVSERFDAGWTATIDGKATTPARINGDFLGVVVESGTHVVELRYQPKALARGQLVSLAGLCVLLAGVIGILRVNPRLPADPGSVNRWAEAPNRVFRGSRPPRAVSL